MKKERVGQRILKQYRNKVRKARLSALISTQEELSRMSGIDRCTINSLENNRLFLSAPHALILAEVLKCALGDLYEKR